jgi:hypothetical protein
VAAFVSIGTGNWDDGPTTWGTGAGVYPGSAQAGDTVTIGDGVHASQVVTLNVDLAYSLGSITNGDSTSYIAVSTTRAITVTAATGIAYAGTNTSGFVRITANTLTITGGGAGTTTISNTGTGYSVVVSSTGVVVLTNASGTLISATAGRGIYLTGNGSCSFTGALSVTGTALAYAISFNCTGGTQTVSASIAVSNTNSSSTAIYNYAGTVNYSGASCTCSALSSAIANVGSGATLNITSVPTSTAAGAPPAISAGTCNWTGSLSLGSDGVYTNCQIRQTGGTLNLRTTSDQLTLTCYGVLCIQKSGTSTLNIDTSNGHTPSIVLQSAHASAHALGDTDLSPIVSVLNLSAGNVKSGVTIYGITGNYTGGGGGCVRRGSIPFMV